MPGGHPARHQAQIEITVGGQQSPPNRLWHMDAYEKRDGRWQVVWKTHLALDGLPFFPEVNYIVIGRDARDVVHYQ